jgi:hypothetical protein
LPPGFCRRCRACARPGHARTFARRAFGACDQHAWAAFVYVCLSLWKRGFAHLALLALWVLLWVFLAGYLPFVMLVGLTILGVKVSPAIPFAVSGVAALCIAGSGLYSALARPSRRPSHITCNTAVVDIIKTWATTE